MTNPYRALCVELAEELVSEYGYCTEWKEGLPLCLSNVSELLTRARALLDQQEPQPEPEGPTDEEARELADDLGITRGFFDHECGLHISCADLEPFARAVLARYGRPTPQPPAAGEAAEVLQWPAEWSRRQRAQEAEMLCCSAGMTPGKEMQRLVQDARDGMPLQHLHDLISHAIPTPQPAAAGEVVELVEWLRKTGKLLHPDYSSSQVPYMRAAELLLQHHHLLGLCAKELDCLMEQHQHPQPVAHVDVGIEWRPCVKLPITVHVRDQRPGETHSSTREGITPLRSNDLIMRGVQGEEYPIGRELFEQTYKLLPANALPTPEANAQ